MTEWSGLHQSRGSSHQSINILAVIGLIGGQLPFLQQNPTWSESLSKCLGELRHDKGLTGQVNTPGNTLIRFVLCTISRIWQNMASTPVENSLFLVYVSRYTSKDT